MSSQTKNFIKNQLLAELAEGASSKSEKYYIDSGKKRKFLMQMFLKKSENKLIPKVPAYMETIKLMSCEIFFTHFRMERDCFLKLVKAIEPHWCINKLGRPKMKLETALYITIWFLSNKNCYREISDRFNISKSRCYEVVKEMCELLTALASKYVKWPNAEEQKVIMEKFNKKQKLPNVVGSVDGTHFQVTTPKNDSSSYYNRKGFHSVLMQGICDSEYCFIDVFVGWPGKAHDAHIWRNSPIGRYLKEGKIVIEKDAHLIGDSAYPLLTYLLTPYKDYGNLTPKKKKYNYYLSSVRVCIEQAFGILKAKFQILQRINVRNISHTKFIIMACVVLHNFIIKNSTDQVQIPEVANIDGNTINEENNEEAQSKRDEICEWIWQNH